MGDVSGARTTARRAALSSALAVAVAGVLAVGALSTASPSGAAGFDPAETWTWSDPEPAFPGVAADAARLEVLPGGRVAALAVVGTELVTRVRDASGTWGDPQSVSLGAGAPAARTFDTFADSAGRVVAVWAVKDTTSSNNGRWPVRSLSRSVDGTWGTPEELYVARTNGALGDLTEISGIAPRLVPVSDTVTLAWATVTNAPSSRTDVAEDPFRARRWTAGVWGAEVRSDGYGTEALDVQPFAPDQVTVWADARQAVRSSDGRISFVYSLRKQRITHSMAHPLSDQTGPNVAEVWDGVAERPWDAISNTAWVVHLDPGQGWSAPAKLVIRGGPPVACATVNLPSNPPLVAHWAQWKAFSQDPGISTSCPGEDSRPTSASYDDDGALRIQLDYQAEPTGRVVLNQFLDKACDDPSATNAYRFCFDQWESVSWGIRWPTAGITIAPGASRPAPEAIREDPWPADRSTRVSTTSGSVTVHEQAGAGDAIRFERAGTEVVWDPDPADTTAVRVQHVFAHGDDVAVFFWRSPGGVTATTLPGCGMAVLRGGSATVDPPIMGCLAASSAHREDVVQLADGRLAWINGEATGSPLRLFAPTTEPSPSPTTPTDSTPPGPSPTPDPEPTPPAPVPPAPVPPAPVPPAPVPPSPTTFTVAQQPTVTGKLRVGRTLTARPGTWVPTPSAVSFRWYAGTKAVPGATKAKLRLTDKLDGKRITVRITLTRPGVTTTTRTVKVPGRVR